MDIIAKIIESAVYAPSGENTQPWRFIVRGDEIKLYNIPERDISPYNWEQKGSFVSHGAVLRNIEIAAQHFGHNAITRLFPDSKDQNYIASIVISRQGRSGENLFPFITKRCTNRKPYKNSFLDDKSKEFLLNCREEGGNARFLIISDSEKIKKLAVAAAENEKILFDNQKMHGFFFSHINWTSEDDEKKRLGFFVKTFELPRPAEMMFRLFADWKRLEFFKKIKFPVGTIIASANARVYAKASTIGAIVVPSTTPEDFISVGKLMQSIWLTATKLGISMQPLAGITFLRLIAQRKDGVELSVSQKQAVLDAYSIIAECFTIADGHIAMMFRIGFADAPTACALRLPPRLERAK